MVFLSVEIPWAMSQGESLYLKSHISQNSMALSDMVMISRAELERLQKLEAELPDIIQKAKEEEAKEALRRLHQRDKENPEAHRQRSKKLYERKKEEILAKRREAYRKRAKANAENAATQAENP